MQWRGNVAILIATILSSAVDTSAFVTPGKTSAIQVVPRSPAESKTTLNVEEYGEASRKYRRTVYTHEEWVKHRSPDRFIRNLKTIVNSGVYQGVGKEVLATTLVATFVVMWNCAVGGYTGLDGTKMSPFIEGPLLGLPAAPFNLVLSSLGLLLVFRSNTSYKRWDEARKFWGLNINHTRDLCRMATAWYGTETTIPVDKEKRKEDLRQISLCTWAFVRSMKRHLSPPWEDEEAFKAELYEKLTKEQAAGIIAAAHRPNKALSNLSNAIDVLPMHFLRKNQINDNLSIFEDTLGGSERLLSSPVPLFYSRHAARFLLIFLLLVPFSLWDAFSGSWNHAAMIPATTFISICLFGIDEISTQLEEPFTVLPMQGFCDKIGNWCNEIVSWADDRTVNGVEVKSQSSVRLDKLLEESNMM